jgi:hypothetical protein
VQLGFLEAILVLLRKGQALVQGLPRFCEPPRLDLSGAQDTK